MWWNKNTLTVVPVINCLDADCAHKKTAELGEFLKPGDWVHVDVADGRFTFNKTWRNPRDWATLRLPYNLEVHLMIEEPERHISDWLAVGAKRLILHAETLHPGNVHKVLVAVARGGAEAMLAFNPETAVEKVRPYYKRFSSFQVLAVSPGPAGQKFLPIVLDKIKLLRHELPNVKIEVDGGITPETAKLARVAGADLVASGTYIFSGKDPQKAYKKLQKA